MNPPEPACSRARPSGIRLVAASATGKGLRTVVNVFGFREFLRRVEKDYIDRIEKTPELFEKYPP